MQNDDFWTRDCRNLTDDERAVLTAIEAGLYEKHREHGTAAGDGRRAGLMDALTVLRTTSKAASDKRRVIRP